MNKIQNSLAPSLKEKAKRIHVEITGFIPFDENIVQLNQEGKTTDNLPESSPAVREMRNILETLL